MVKQNKNSRKNIFKKVNKYFYKENSQLFKYVFMFS
jgi:hypothetical protein